MKSTGFSEAPAWRAPDVFDHLIERLCPAYRNRITAELRPEEKDGFQLADAPGGRIRISGNTPVSLAAGLNYYLRERAGVHLSWCGDRLALPPEPPPVSTEVRREFPLPLRPCLNYCTFGYSMVWWEWPRWEREIDFMALNGINMPLAVTGIEAIYLRTLLHFGLSREEILAFLSGPAFLPWQYMNNLDSHAGPLPSPWITSHLALGRRILERERAWGMKPILPGFSGHVPEAFARLYPRCRFIRSEGWCGFAPVVTIDPADPMFAEVNAVFLRELTGAFGTDHYYSIDLFHEQRLDRCSPDHLAACGRSVSAALLAADPEAVWVMQAWSERPEIIRNIPAGRLLLLDIGKERLKATGGLDGRPVVWGTIHSFGGQTEIGGDLAAIPREIAEQRRRFPNLAGAGAFPESIGNNPVLFELVFDSALCGGELDLEQWVRGYLRRRYGRESAAAVQAWRFLLRDVYTERRGDPIFAARPALRPDRANAWAGFNPNDVPLHFFPAWEKLLEAAPALGGSDGYRFDVIDLGRQALSAFGMQLHRRCSTAYEERNAGEFRRAADRFLELLNDCDALLGSRPEFRLDRWIADARRWGTGPAEKAYYEWNARLLVTLWGPVESPEPLFDYCCREWHGLLRDYYGVRWAMFFDYVTGELQAGRSCGEAKLPRVEGRIALKANAFYRELHRFEQAYVRQISPDRPPEPCPDELAAARRMFEKYAPRLADYPVAARRKTGSRRPAADVPAGFAGDGAVLL